MSWNSTFIAIKRDLSRQLDQLQTDLGITLGEPIASISWEEATASSVTGKSVGIGDGWTIICDPFMFLDSAKVESPAPDNIWLPTIETGLEICSVGSIALGFIVAGVSDTYGMTIHHNGKLLRCRLVQEGKIIVDAGKPLAEEAEAFDEEADEELRVFLLLEKFGLSSDKLEHMQFTLYEPAAA